MLSKDKKETEQVIFFSMESFVPQDHLLRKIESAVDFSVLYDIVGELYCLDNGRPSIAPVILFKMVLIQHLYGIRSLRRTSEEIEMNVAYRWFLGYLMNEKTPHFATVSYNFKHRFTEKTIEKVFNWILSEINKKGYSSPEVVFIDGTHIKANANMKKSVTKAIPVAAKIYEEQLLKEINEDREEHNKKPFEPKDKGEKKISESKTDPDSVAFDPLFDKLYESFPQIETVAAYSAYKTAWICKKLTDMKIKLSAPYKRSKGNKNKGFRAYDYVYDEYYDCVICPQNQILEYSTTNRDGYKEFKSNPDICRKCPKLEECTKSKNFEKVSTKHIWQEYIEIVEELRYILEIKKIYEKRKETVERVFADAKEKHGMRYTTFRSLAQVTKWVKLKFACMNLKKFALHLSDGKVLFLLNKLIINIFANLTPIFINENGVIDSLRT